MLERQTERHPSRMCVAVLIVSLYVVVVLIAVQMMAGELLGNQGTPVQWNILQAICQLRLLS